MADRYQTQCPHCGVKFQITAQQLQLAGGTVRCGSCLQVFQANQNMVPLAQPPAAGVASARPSARPATPADAQATVQRPAINVPPPKPAAPASAAPSARPARPAAPADEDLVSKILREIEEHPAAPTKPAAAPPPAARPPAARPQGGAPATPPPAAPKPATDPTWAPPPAAAKPAPAGGGGWAPPPAKPSAAPAARAPAKGAARTDSKFATDDPFGVQATTYDEKNFKPEADESWAKDLIGEKPLDEREERVRKFQISADELKLDKTTGIQHTSGLAARLQQMEAEAPPTEMPSPIRRTAPAGGSQVDDEFDFLSDPGLTMQDVELPAIEEGDDSLVAAAQAHQVRWGKDVFWGTLSAVFLFVLLGQYLVANRDTLARDPAWQGVYAAACGALGCELPAASDPRRIQGAHLVVRSHPSVAGALVVDAIIYNRASFAQPFPRLELGFSDMNGNPVAGRVFAPSEYLKGELAETSAMPPDTPIHLSLEIRDPGPAAASYELRFLTPEAPAPDAS